MGLPTGTHDFYLTADTAKKFQDHLQRLHGSFDERVRLSDEAYRIAREHFSSEACFTQLAERLT
jgi:hypothetical protein